MHPLNLLLVTFLSTAALSSAAAIPQSILPIRTNQDNNTTQLPYGVVLNHCTVPNTIAIAFDDGPYIYTEQVLDILANASIHATFFFNGDWKGNIYELAHIVKRTFAEGHQIGSHSYVFTPVPPYPRPTDPFSSQNYIYIPANHLLHHYTDGAI